MPYGFSWIFRTLDEKKNRKKRKTYKISGMRQRPLDIFIRLRCVGTFFCCFVFREHKHRS